METPPLTSRQHQNIPPLRKIKRANGTASRPTTKQIQNENLSPEFINVTDMADLDESSKTKVRVQVMKDYHRRRIQKFDENGVETLDHRPEPPPISAKSQTQKFRLGYERVLRPWKPRKSERKKDKVRTSSEEERKLPSKELPYRVQDDVDTSHAGLVSKEDESSTSIHQATEAWLSSLEYYVQNSTLPSSPSNGMLDPFAAMSLLITPRTQRLLHHYFTLRLPTSWLMMPMRRAFLTHSLHDPALFHTFLSHYAASYHTSHRSDTAKSDPDEAIYHRTMAIKLVNERIRLKKDELSDGSVGAVANLAIYESSNGSKESMLVHLNGLEEMVNLRGGLETGGFNPHVRRLIGWTDLHCSAALLSSPRFTRLQLSAFTPALGLRDLLTQTQVMSETFQELKKGGMPREDISYSDRVYCIQRQLFEVIYEEKSTKLEVACATAALVFCYHVLRDISLGFGIARMAVRRLKGSLEGVMGECEGSGKGKGELLFWTVGFGAVAAEGKEEGQWFVGRFRGLCSVLGVRRWEDVRGRLGRVLWADALDERGKRVWDEVAESGPS